MPKCIGIGLKECYNIVSKEGEFCNSCQIKLLEQENVSMRECISSVLMRLADYDGYETVKGLKYLIDDISEILKSGYPERIMNWRGKEDCPLCLQELKNKKK